MRYGARPKGPAFRNHSDAVSFCACRRRSGAVAEAQGARLLVSGPRWVRIEGPQGRAVPMTDRPILASDKERDSVVDVLRDAYTEGRLTLEEFEDRMAAAYAARTWGDLRELTGDLPVEPVLGTDLGHSGLRAAGHRALEPADRAHSARRGTAAWQAAARGVRLDHDLSGGGIAGHGGRTLGRIHLLARVPGRLRRARVTVSDGRPRRHRSLSGNTYSSLGSPLL